MNPVVYSNNLTTDTSRSRSPAIWSKIPSEEFRITGNGYHFRPDLFNCPKFASTVSQMGLITLQDTGVTIQGDPTQPGVMQWGGMDADNDAGIITAAGNVGTAFVISDSDLRTLAFEVSIKKSSIGNNS